MKKILLSLTILASAVASTQAGLVLSDQFPYPDGPIVGAPGSPWQNHSGTAGSMLVSNNILVDSRLRTEDINAPLAGAPYLTSGGISLYSFYTMAISNDLPTVVGGYFSHFRGTNTGAASDFGARVFVLQSNTVSFAPVPAGKYRVSIGNGAASTNDTYLGQIDQDLSINTIYKVVTRFVPATGQSTIWLNPSAETDPHADATDPGNAAAANPFNVFTYAFRQGTGHGTVYVDDLKIGTSFADVLGAPLISTIPDQSSAMNATAGPLGFTVQSGRVPTSSLVVSSNSSNPALVPTANISLATVPGTGGTNRTVTIIPATGQQGSTTITLTVTDGTYTSTSSFVLRVGAPTISAIANVIAYTNTSIPAVPFTVHDPEGDTVILSATSGDTTLLPVSGITFGGSGDNRTVTLTPTAGLMGWAQVTIKATDTHSTNSSSFVLTVAPKLGVVFSDNFAYTHWDFVPNALTESSSGSPWVTAGGTAYEMQVTNPVVYLVATNSEDAAATLTNKLGGTYNTAYETTNAVVFYSTFSVNASELGQFTGEYFFHLKSSNTGTSGFEDKIYARTNGAVAGKLRLAVANFSTGPSATFPLDLDLNTTYTVVTRYNSATGESVLWVNPYSELSRNAPASDNPSPSFLGSVSLRQPSSGDYGKLTLGALKIATAWNELGLTAPALPSAIPLAVQMAGGNAQFSWSNVYFMLQSAPALTGPWTTIPSALSGYSIAPSETQKYFRLICQ